jgi:hypothetical protein
LKEGGWLKRGSMGAFEEVLVCDIIFLGTISGFEPGFQHSMRFSNVLLVE